MKKITLTLALLLCLTTLSFGQTKGFTFGAWLQAMTNKPYCTDYNFNMQSFTAAPGYSFNGRLFARVPISSAIELYQLPEGRTYQTNGYLGVTLGYDVMSNKSGIVEIAGTFGSSIFSNSSKYIYYDVGVNWMPFSGLNKFCIGLGVRYHQTGNSNYKSYTTMTGTIGYRFN